MEKTKGESILKNIWIFAGLVIVSISIIVCTLIITSHDSSQRHTVNGNLGLSQVTISDEGSSEYMSAFEVRDLLGYHDVDVLTQDVLNNKIHDLPYFKLNGKIYFSRSTFNEWLVNATRSNNNYDD